jgi:multidrug efflux pump subunit AcrA (membrane-fusion protein)
MVRVPRASLSRLPAASRPRLPAVLAASIILVGLTAAACGEDDAAVGLTSVARVSVAEVVDAAASVTARSTATLSAPADGTLASLRVGPGDRVRPGQLLAVIDSPAAKDRLNRARRALETAQRSGPGIDGDGDLARTQQTTDRAAEQAFDAARQAASEIADQRRRAAMLAQIQAAQWQYAMASRAASDAVRAVGRGVAGLEAALRALSAAQRVQAQQAYDLAEATVDALTLRAPIGGVVQFGGNASPGAPGNPLAGLAGTIAGLEAAAGVTGFGAAGGGTPSARIAGVDGAVPVGARVTAGTPIVTVVDVTELGLVAEVDETDVLLVTPGTAAIVELDAVAGASYPAEVRSVDLLPSAAPGGGVSYRVRLSLAAGSLSEGGVAPAPRPGMSAVVHLRVREAPDAVSVPAAAVFSADGRDAVWVVRDGRADRVAVTVGVQGEDVVQIVAGVHPGEQVVVRGFDQVRPGQQLR